MVGMFKRLFEYAVGEQDLYTLFIPVYKFWSFLERNKVLRREVLAMVFERLVEERSVEDQVCLVNLLSLLFTKDIFSRSLPFPSQSSPGATGSTVPSLVYTAAIQQNLAHEAFWTVASLADGLRVGRLKARMLVFI